MAAADDRQRIKAKLPWVPRSRLPGVPGSSIIGAMCGRYMLMDDPALLERAFGFAECSDLPRQLQPRFNIAPTQPVPIVRDRPGRPLDIVRETGGGVRELVIARWGLIPSWAKDAAIGNRMINARAETVAEKPAFRSALRARRCIVPASG